MSLFHKRRSLRLAASAAVLMAALGGHALAADDIPRMPGGEPDLNGTWDNGGGIPFVAPVSDGDSICLVGCAPAEDTPRSPGIETYTDPDRPTYKAEYRAKVEDLRVRQVEEDPILRCAPPGVPRIGPPDKIVQTASEVVFLYEDVSGPFFRMVPLNQKEHRNDVEPAYLGYSIGWWEGDELVVETTNFRTDTWLSDDGSFHTADLRVVERLHREGDTLYWRATAHDPEVLEGPWEMREREAWLTDVALVEAPPCVERDLEHMQDMSYHGNSR